MIGGSTSKTALIRVIGPGITTLGINNAPSPTHNSRSTTTVTKSLRLTSAGLRVNAFSIGTAPTKDSMLLVTLPAGGYTAPATGTGGVAIVEAYEVP
jgi:hypothetical protein